MTFTKTSSGKAVTRADFVNARMATVGSQLTGVYRSIATRAPGTAKLVATTYPRLFSENDRCAVGFGFTRDDVQWIRKSVDRLDEAIVRRARNEGFTVVDTRHAFDDNLLCDNSSRSWIKGVNLFDLQESFHPNRLGNEAYSQLVQAALEGETNGRMRMMSIDAVLDGADEAARELADAGFNEAEIAEISEIDVEYVDIVQLGEFTQTDQCEAPVPGETVVYNGGGFEPHSPVEISISGIPDPVEVPADAEGNVTGTIKISLEISEGIVAVDLTGVDPSGKPRILSAMSEFEASEPCAAKARAALVAFEDGSGGTGSLSGGSLGDAASSSGSAIGSASSSGSEQSSRSSGSGGNAAGN